MSKIVAKEASVSRQAVYLHFSSRAELLIATTRHIDEVQDVAGQFRVINQQHGVDRLDAFINAWGNYIPVVYGGARTMIAAKDSDPDVAEAWKDRMDALLSACTSVIDELSKSKNLRKELSKKMAADLLWANLSVQQWEILTKDRGWSQTRYIKTMKTQLKRLLVTHNE